MSNFFQNIEWNPLTIGLAILAIIMLMSTIQKYFMPQYTTYMDFDDIPELNEEAVQPSENEQPQFQMPQEPMPYDGMIY